MNRRQFVYRSTLLSLAAAGLPLASRAFRQGTTDKKQDFYAGDKRQEADRNYAYAVRLPQVKTPAELKGLTGIELIILDYGSGDGKPEQTVYNLPRKGGADVNETYLSFMTGKPTLLRGTAKAPEELLSKTRVTIQPHDNVMFSVDRDTIMLNYREPDSEDSGELSDCFLTSACVSAKGLPDDCRELTTLRAYRDGYLRQTTEGAAMVQEYYCVGPRIVAAINSRSNRQAIYGELYNSLVIPSLAYIDAGALAEAREHYHAYTETLKEIFLRD